MGSTGKSTGSIPLDLNDTAMSGSEQLRAVRQLQSEMGQTGDEAGLVNVPGRNKLYVATSKAFDINYFLNTGLVGSPMSNWTNLGYTKRMIQNDINKIDSGMKPMSQSLTAYRYVTAAALSRMLGDKNIQTDSDVRALISAIKNDPKVAKAFGTQLRNTDYTQKSYSSVSYVKEHSTFDAYPVRFKTVVGKGTPAIVTNNHREHEVLVQRNQKYNFTGRISVKNEYSAALGRNQDYLEIEVRL